MRNYNLKKGMVLFCKNGETVILEKYTHSAITVKYKGVMYERPISTINKTLFVRNPVEFNRNQGYKNTNVIEKKAKSNNKIHSSTSGVVNDKKSASARYITFDCCVDKHKNDKDGYTGRVVTISNGVIFEGRPSNTIVAKLDSDENYKFDSVSMNTNLVVTNENKSCLDCYYNKSGECTSWKPCKDFKPAIQLSKSDTDCWPTEGDATFIKRHGRKK